MTTNVTILLEIKPLKPSIEIFSGKVRMTSEISATLKVKQTKNKLTNTWTVSRSVNGKVST